MGWPPASLPDRCDSSKAMTAWKTGCGTGNRLPRGDHLTQAMDDLAGVDQLPNVLLRQLGPIGVSVIEDRAKNPPIKQDGAGEGHHEEHRPQGFSLGKRELISNHLSLLQHGLRRQQLHIGRIAILAQRALDDDLELRSNAVLDRPIDAGVLPNSLRQHNRQLSQLLLLHQLAGAVIVRNGAVKGLLKIR